MTEVDIIPEQAEQILAEDPDGIVRFRLLRDVLRRRSDDRELVSARKALDQSPWIRKLKREQRSDGSWGLLHGVYSPKGTITTTEVGVERALALGLDRVHPVLQKACQYLTRILGGKIQCRDRPERNDRWPTEVHLFAASTLARIAPNTAVIDKTWNFWLNIASRSFASGVYDPKAEVCAHRELTGASVGNSYLVLRNKYSLVLLGSRAGILPRVLEAALLHWIWRSNLGIFYLGVPLSRPPLPTSTSSFDRWITSLELLSPFPSWGVLTADAIRWFWKHRGADGLWGFGPRWSQSRLFPLSGSWRSERARRFDWSTRVLALLSKYYSR